MPRPRKRTGARPRNESVENNYPVEARTLLPKGDSGVAGGEDSGDEVPVPANEEGISIIGVEGGRALESAGSDEVPVSEGEGTPTIDPELALDAHIADGEEAANEAKPTSNGAFVPVQAAIKAEIVTDTEAADVPLTDDQRERLRELEHQVEESFYRAGIALREIRDSRLYRETHGSFEEYCLERFGFRRRHPYQLIDAAIITDNIRGSARIAHVLPTNEYQLRPLVKLKDAERQAEAWTRAVEKTAGKPPTYEVVKETVSELLATEKDQTAARLHLEVNQPVIVKRADDEMLSDLVGAWGIVRNVDERGVTVEFYAGTITCIDGNCLGRFPIVPNASELRSLEKTLSQLKTIFALASDEVIAKNTVKYFVRLRRPTLTDLERYMLTALERGAAKKERRAPETE